MQQASEQDLWQLFSPAGDVLELAILRSQGRSKGCAFLTYATRQQVGGTLGPRFWLPAGRHVLRRHPALHAAY